ncbi:MAG: P-loop NTPase fold protein [Microcystaceae cyanobacterium]
MTNSSKEEFRQAYQNLQLLPLVTQAQIDRFGVKYAEDVIESLSQLVEDCSNNNDKIIFTGHRGSGKSTLLGQFALKMRDQYFVTFFSIADLIELSDVNHINILFATAVKLMETAEEQDVTINDKVKKAFYQWFSQHTQVESSQIAVDSELEVSGKAGVDAWWVTFFTKLKNTLKVNAFIRNEIKTTFTPRISELVDSVNSIAVTIQAATGKEVLVIIDDLDKLSLDLVESIYINNINSLFQPQFRMIYTIPKAATKNKEVKGVVYSATNNRILSVWATKFFSREDANNPDATPYDEAVKVFAEVLDKRIDSKLIEEDVILPLILASGGALRELIRLGSRCCEYCLIQLRRTPDNNDIKINLEILQKAIRDLRIEFTESLGKEDYEVLVQVNNDQEPLDSNDQIFLDLLHGLNILEYKNDDLWYGLHPVVKELVERRRKK